MSARSLDDYPERLFIEDMAAIFRVSVRRAYDYAAEGAFDFAVNKPQIGRPSWSRARVKQYFAGELRGLTPVRAKRA